MTIRELIKSDKFKLINQGVDIDREISGVFCCDLLSMAMSKANEGCAWVTVMANQNTLAVSVLIDAACIILAEGMSFDEPTIERAVSEGITIFSSDIPIYESAAFVAEVINA